MKFKRIYIKIDDAFIKWTMKHEFRHGAVGLVFAVIGWSLFGNWYCLIPPIAYSVGKELSDWCWREHNWLDHFGDIAAYAVGGLIAQLILYWRG